MKIVANALNAVFFADILKLADVEALEGIRLAVAYVSKVDDILDLARKREVPVALYALADGSFPTAAVIRRFREGPLTWRLFLTRAFYHPKIYWFEGVGAYIGSANLTDGGAFSNLECGVWFEHRDLSKLGFDTQLEAAFRVVHSRSAPSSQEVLDAYDRIKGRAFALERAKSELASEIDRLLAFIPGQKSPLNQTARTPGGEGKRAFLEEWHSSLDLLRKLSVECRRRPWPKWVSRDVPPTIIWDQATELWFEENVRATRQSAAAVAKLHVQNENDPQAAVEDVLNLWRRAEPTADWEYWVNEAPQSLRRLLSPTQLDALTQSSLKEIIIQAHASREHARQIANFELGLPVGEEHSKEERCDIFAQFLLKHRTESGFGVADVLKYVLWGDRQTPDCAERIWNAVTDGRWKLPHLGINILGELVGYARPDDFPPRNNRVSRCLHALGFPNISYQ